PAPPAASAPTATDDAPPFRYTAALANRIEARWQDAWDAARTFQTPNPGEPGFDGSRPKKFILDMFPYPSGAGLHVGHPLGYIATDIFARYLRMTGHNVLHAMGFDAFGLPAEQYAVQTNTHPRVTTEANIATMRRQLRRLGLGHDPRRGVSTTDEAFYKWTQWIFLQIYQSWYDPEAPARDGVGKGRARPIAELIRDYDHGRRRIPGDDRPWSQVPEEIRRRVIDSHRLAYLAEVPVNWCPMLGTVLANEEVTSEGRSERGDYPVYKRPLKQWMLRITAYAERLIDDLNMVDWPESVKLLQRNWIGRSEGAYVDFACANRRIRVFTTRPDTLFGATFLVLAPDHPMVDELAGEKYTGSPSEPARVAVFDGAHELTERGAGPRAVIAAYRELVRRKAESAAEQGEGAEKTGVFIGAYAINPATQQRVPVFIADYVMMGYGTGAIMAVPAHDERDFAFADRFGLPVRCVVRPADNEPGVNAEAVLAGRECFSGAGVAMNSPAPGSPKSALDINGLAMEQAKKRITVGLQAAGFGEAHTTYKLRDWLFSRQRYWGEPFPIVFDEQGHAHALPERMLPVVLPKMDNFQPEASTDPDAPPRPPLARAQEWASVELDLGDGRGTRRFTRETNTMPNWAGSCWYYLRYLDPENAGAFVGKEAEAYWMLGRSALRADSSSSPLDRSSFSPSSVLSAAFTARNFQGRDPYPPGQYGIASEVLSWGRRLPHLEMAGATYFVTWRVVEGDRLTERERDAVLAAIRHFHGQRHETYVACVMPDHVHWIVRPLGEHRLRDLIASVKKFSATAVNDSRKASGSLWQPDAFDHIIRDESALRDFIRYVVRNPVEGAVVSDPDTYAWTFLGEGIVEVQKRSEVGRGSGSSESVGTECRPTHGVDLYVGGVEHAVLHLLYARFWHKVLFDLGQVSTPEPFGRLFNQGYIQAFAYRDIRGMYVPAEEVVERDQEVHVDIDRLELSSGEGEPVQRVTRFFWNDQPVFQEYGKMGKSLKNAVAPDEVCRQFGCDTLRLYEMSMGPLEASKPWNTRDIAGSYRFLQRAWRCIIDEQTGKPRISDAEPPAALARAMHRTIDGVRKDMAALSFNTAVSKLIEFVNELTKAMTEIGSCPRICATNLTLMLAPLAPHVAEELWSLLGNPPSVAFAGYPAADPAMLVESEIEYAVQVQGKVRARIMAPAAADAKTVEAIAMGDANVKAFLEGKAVKKVIVVPGKLVNVVV
ncbi:MAG: class I tRNA ligase family protein, partial [Phycisphaeraceae bacterium]|nr:class I tRNA ligase family protein [Phycisphaeraceae bacterium]